MQVIKANKADTNKLAASLKRGAVIILPSDTVYGLVCDADNKKSVERIFKIKKRPKTKPLGVFVKNIKMAKKIAVIDEKQEEFLKKNTSGKITVILKKRQTYRFPESVGDETTIGIRIIKNKLVNQLLEKLGKPLAQTSANISGKPPSTKIADVLKQFQRSSGLRGLLVVDAGDLPKSKPSKIVDLTGTKPLTKIR